MGKIKDANIDSEPEGKKGKVDTSFDEQVAKRLHLAKNRMLEDRTLNIVKLRSKRRTLDKLYKDASRVLSIEKDAAYQLLKEDETYKAFTNSITSSGISISITSSGVSIFLAIVGYIAEHRNMEKDSDLKHALENDIRVTSEGILYKGEKIPSEIFDK